MRKRTLLLLILVWVVILGGFIAIKEYTLRTGEEVLLKTVPIDPRDIFRGDYVILRYEISRLSVPSDVREGDAVYVALRRDGNYAFPNGVTREAPPKGLFIKGKVQQIYGGLAEIEYGIESYFVPEGQGKSIEQARRSKLEVKVAIDARGKALIKTLYLDGNEVRFK